MKQLIGFICAIVLVGCASNSKYEFTTTDGMREEAVREFEQSRSDMLFLFMVDREGNIVAAKVVADRAKNIDYMNKKIIKLHLRRNVKYPKAAEFDPDYREFFYATTISTSVEFF